MAGKKILIAGAGGAPSEGVINSLLLAENPEIVIGMGSEPTDLALSKASRRYYVPYANAPEYSDCLLRILEKERPDLVHFQNDLEIYQASKLREEIAKSGVNIFMPEHDVIDRCVHKYKTYLAFVKAGIKVPQNLPIANERDLQIAFRDLADERGRIWLRSSTIGGGGKGALPTSDYSFATGWINHYKGWGEFVAAEMLTADSVTFLSLWCNGELIVGQSRARQGWAHGNRTLSGVTGVTKVATTINDDMVVEVALRSIKAVSNKPHGIFGVDMTYDSKGIPNPTEINISRFFTTILFFTKAGLNMPEIFKDLALTGRSRYSGKKINPLPNGLLWLRGMDIEPMLTSQDGLSEHLEMQV